MMVAASTEEAKQPQATATTTATATATTTPRLLGKRVRKSFGARFFWGLVVGSYDVGGAPFFKVRFDDGDVDVFAAPEVLQDIKQAEKYAREDKTPPSALALKMRMLAQTGATSYDDEVRRTALKRKRSDERNVQVTPVRITEENAPQESSNDVEVTVWSTRLYLSIITNRKMTSIAEFVKREDGSPGEVEATGRVAVGDIITHINGRMIYGLASGTVSEMIRSSPRPLVISFKKRVPLADTFSSSTRVSPAPAQKASEETIAQAQPMQATQPAPSQPLASGLSQSSSSSLIPTTSVIPPTRMVTVPSTTEYQTSQPSTRVDSTHFVQQPVFGAPPHSSLHTTASATQQDYAAAVRANPWNRTYTNTAQQMRAGTMPAYGMQMPMNPQAQSHRQLPTSVATTTTHYNQQHPISFDVRSPYPWHQSHPSGASPPTQQYTQQHQHTAATSMMSAYPSQHAQSAPQPQRTYEYSSNYDAQVSTTGSASYVAPQSMSNVPGGRFQQAQPPPLRSSDSAQIIDNSARELSPTSSSPPQNHRSGRVEASSFTGSTNKTSKVSVQSEEPHQQAGTQDNDGAKRDESSSHTEDRNSYELDGTSSADELAGVLGLESSDPLVDLSSSSSPSAVANMVEEMSFLKPNKPSFVTHLPVSRQQQQQQPHQSFQQLQQLPLSTSRFGMFDGEECVIVLIQRPRLRVTLSPLGKHISISSFARGDNDEPGEIEESGKVFIGDIIVGVNGMRLNPELSPTDLGRLLVALVRPFEIYFKRASWETLEGGLK